MKLSELRACGQGFVSPSGTEADDRAAFSLVQGNWCLSSLILKGAPGQDDSDSSSKYFFFLLIQQISPNIYYIQLCARWALDGGMGVNKEKPGPWPHGLLPAPSGSVVLTCLLANREESWSMSMMMMKSSSTHFLISRPLTCKMKEGGGSYTLKSLLISSEFKEFLSTL